MWFVSKRKDFERRVLSELEGVARTCRYLTGSDAEADRLVEETVAETYRTWNTLRQDCSGRIPVFSVLTEQFLRYLAPGSRLSFFCPSDELDEDLTADVRDFSLPIDRSQVTPIAEMADDDIRYAVSCLPPSIRLVTVLTFREGFSYAEIGEIVGIPVEVARTWIHQGHRQLRQALLILADRRSDSVWSGSQTAVTG